MTTISATPVLQLEIRPHDYGPAFDFLGTRFLTKAEGNAMNNAFCIREVVLPTGAHIPLHLHPEPEFFYVLAGSCEFATIEDGVEKWAVSETGDSILIPVGVPHALRNVSGADVRLLAVTTYSQELFLREAGTPADPEKPPRAASGEELERVFTTAARFDTYTVTPERSLAGQASAVAPTQKLVPRCYWRLERVS
jgi:quercetin dioxygenase-like cupin family protein